MESCSICLGMIGLTHLASSGQTTWFVVHPCCSLCQIFLLFDALHCLWRLRSLSAFSFRSQKSVFLPDLPLALWWEDISKGMPWLPKWHSLVEPSSETEAVHVDVTWKYLLRVRGPTCGLLEAAELKQGFHKQYKLTLWRTKLSWPQKPSSAWPSEPV